MSATSKAAGPAKTKPNTLMFYGKNILAVAIGTEVTFGKSKKRDDGGGGNVQAAVPFRILEGQRATIYAVPEGSSLKEGDFAEVPAGTLVTYVKALTPEARPYAIEALRNGGWYGSKFADLQAGQAHGLGEQEVRLTISVRETDMDGNLLVDESGNFRPQMVVEWVNKGAAFAFKEEASADDLKLLDKEAASDLRPPPGRGPAKTATPPAPGKTAPAPATQAKTAAAPAGAPAKTPPPPAKGATTAPAKPGAAPATAPKAAATAAKTPPPPAKKAPPPPPPEESESAEDPPAEAAEGEEGAPDAGDDDIPF